MVYGLPHFLVVAGLQISQKERADFVANNIFERESAESVMPTGQYHLFVVDFAKPDLVDHRLRISGQEGSVKRAGYK